MFVCLFCIKIYGNMNGKRDQQMSHLMTKPTKWHVHPAKSQISLASAQSDLRLRCPLEEGLGP